MASVQGHAFEGNALVQYMQMDDGVRDRAEVQKDDSADVTRVYCLDDFVVHGDDVGLGPVMRSVRRLAIRKKSL